jgi:HEAT repeat protein
MSLSFRAVLYWLIRVPVGVLAILTLLLLGLVISGMIVAIASWTLPGIQGTAAGVAAALLLGFLVAWLCRRRSPKPRRGEVSWLETPVILPALTVVVLALAGSVLFPVQRLAAEVLGFTGPSAVPLLLRAAHRNAEVETSVTFALGRIGPPAAPAAVDYLIAIQDTAALEKIGAPAAPRLLALLSDPNLERRRYATRALGKVPVPPEGAVPLAEALTDEDSLVASQAEDALRHMGASAAPAVPHLRQLLASKNEQHIRQALPVLQAIGPPAAEAVPDLIRLLDKLPRPSAEALGAMGPAAVDPLRELLLTSEPRSASIQNACHALARLGPRADAALPDIQPLLRSESSDVRIDAAWAWCSIGGDPKVALPILVDAFHADNQGLLGGPNQAARRLTDLGPLAAPALPDYLRLLHDPDTGVRATVPALIVSLGSTVTPPVEELAEVVRGDKSPLVRERAIQALRQIGTPAASAVPDIRDALAGLPERDRLEGALAVFELGRDPQPLAEWLHRELAGKGFGPGGFPDSVKQAVTKQGPDARPLVPALEEAYRQGSIYKLELARLLYPVDRFLWFYYNPDAQSAAVGLLLLVCLLVETVVYRWRWSRGADRRATTPAASAPDRFHDDPASS